MEEVAHHSTVQDYVKKMSKKILISSVKIYLIVGQLVICIFYWNICFFSQCKNRGDLQLAASLIRLIKER